MKDQIKRIEAVTRKTKVLDQKAEKKNVAKQMARENAELLFKILHEKEGKNQ